MRQFNIITYDKKNNYIEEQHVLGYIIYIDGVDAWYNALRPNQGLYEGQIKLIA